MADTVVVKIDLGLLFDRTDGEENTLKFLREAGFVRRRDGNFVCEEISLRVLDRDEYEIVRGEIR